MLALAEVREPIIEAVRSNLALIRLLGMRSVTKQRLFFPVLQNLQHLSVMHFSRRKFHR